MKIQRYTVLSLVILISFFLAVPVQAQGKAKDREKIEIGGKDKVSPRGKTKAEEIKAKAGQENKATKGEKEVAKFKANDGSEELKAGQSQQKPGNSKKGKVDQMDKAKSKAEAISRNGNDLSLDDNGTAKSAKGKEKSDQGKGNAYGKNKGDLEGRAFGQARATAAREKQQKVENEAEKAVVQSAALQQTARQKLVRAREELEKARQSGQYTESQLERRAAAIERAEAAAGNLEKATEKTKEKVIKQ
ncbi:hypothetical protein CEQ90_08265 [Lewinellaceae bacterium SD302]|nr:hypothetical protein CEQ90_08265 [Lewinellaceae bacterium SD302]